MFEAKLSHGAYKCSRCIEKLSIKIKLEQVAQYGATMPGTKSPETTVSNFKMEKTFRWMESVDRRDDAADRAPLDRRSSGEEPETRLQPKDMLYTLTSHQGNAMQAVDSPFDKINLGNNCWNNLPKLRIAREGRPKETQALSGDLTTSSKLEWESDVQTMVILLSISPAVRGKESKDIVLANLRYNKYLDELRVFPRPNQESKGYKLAPTGVTPPFYLYWIELIEQQHLVHSEPHGCVGGAMPSLLFTRIEPAILNLHLFITIVKFTFYNLTKDDKFFINFSIILPKGWSMLTDSNDKYLSTHTSMEITNGVFQHLVSYSLMNHLNLNKESLLWPKIALALMSDCTETAIQGLCTVQVPPKPGRYIYNLPLNKYNEMKSNDLGTLFNESKMNISQEHLISETNFNEGLEGRYGIVSEAIGSVSLELQSVHQSAK